MAALLGEHRSELGRGVRRRDAGNGTEAIRLARFARVGLDPDEPAPFLSGAALGPRRSFSDCEGEEEPPEVVVIDPPQEISSRCAGVIVIEGVERSDLLVLARPPCLEIAEVETDGVVEAAVSERSGGVGIAPLPALGRAQSGSTRFQESAGTRADRLFIAD